MGDTSMHKDSTDTTGLLERIFLLKSFSTASITMLECIGNTKLEWYSEQHDLYPRMLQLELLNEYAQAQLREVVLLCNLLAGTIDASEKYSTSKEEDGRRFVELHANVRRAMHLIAELDGTMCGLSQDSTKVPDGYEKMRKRTTDVKGAVESMWSVTRLMSHASGEHETLDV